MKRFTETTKWLDGWFSELEAADMLAWLFLLDHCDAAGVIDKPGRMARAAIPLPLDWEEFREKAGDRIQVLPCGKWWLPKFVDYQYKGGVSATSKQHGPIRDSIRKHSLPIEYPSNTHSIGIRYPTNTSQEKEKEKEKETDKEKDKETDKEKDKETKPRKSRGTLEEITEHCREKGLTDDDAAWVFEKWEGNGWKNNGKAINCWKSTISSWKRIHIFPSQKQIATPNGKPATNGKREAWQINADIKAYEAAIEEHRRKPENTTGDGIWNRKGLAKVKPLRAKIAELREEL